MGSSPRPIDTSTRSRIAAHLRAQWAGLLALFLVIAGGTAYAANTIASGDIIDGEVKAPDIAANAINSMKIANGQVTEADIGQGAVGNAELKDNAVSTQKIANGQVTEADIAAAAIANAELKGDAVTTQKVQNETLLGNDVQNNTLKGADIDESTLSNIGGGGPAGGDLTGSYPNPQIGPNAVGEPEVEDQSLTGFDIGADQIDSDELSDGGVFGDDIANNALTGAHIADASLGSSDLGAGSVGGNELATGAVPSKVETVQASSALNANLEKEVVVDCSFADDRVIGGGFVISNAQGQSVPSVAVQRSYPVDSNSWLVRANTAFGGSPTWQVTAVATCVF
jgi:hypothetical protein